MAWHTEEGSLYAYLNDHAALTLPDGDWSMGGWIRRAGTNHDGSYTELIDLGGYAATPSFTLSLRSTDNYAYFRTVDDDGTDSSFKYTSSAVLNNLVWHHAIFIRSGTTVTGYWDTVDRHNWTNADYNGVNAATGLYIGTRASDPTGRESDADFAEWAKWDRALSTPEIAALANGVTPWHFQEDLKWYLPMKRGGTGGDYEDWGPSRLIVTNSGSTHADHSPTGLWTPRGRGIVLVLEAADHVGNIVMTVPQYDAWQ